jgi:AraC-like DNA-binding protein
VRISTDDLPEHDRAAAVREFLGRHLFRCDIEPLPGQQFLGTYTTRSLPGLDVHSSDHAGCRVIRTSEVACDNYDHVIFGVCSSPHLLRQCGRDLTLPAGEACVTPHDASCVTYQSACKVRALRIPCAALRSLLSTPDDYLFRRVPSETPAMRLLMRYFDVLLDESALAIPELQRLAVAHVYDLLAVALGATRDARDAAQGRGVRAARLHAVKKDVVDNIDTKLSVGAISARHGVTARYLQTLFEDEGTTFTEFVRDQRLARAHRMLVSPRFDDRPVSDIAFGVGFGDLSYFYRMFRRRFGLAPGDIRARSNREQDAAGR